MPITKDELILRFTLHAQVKAITRLQKLSLHKAASVSFEALFFFLNCYCCSFLILHVISIVYFALYYLGAHLHQQDDCLPLYTLAINKR